MLPHHERPSVLRRPDGYRGHPRPVGRSHEKAFLGLFPHDMQHDAGVRRVTVMAMSVPFGARPMNLHVASQDGPTGVYQKSASEVRARLSVRPSREADSVRFAILRSQHLRHGALLLPNSVDGLLIPGRPER